MNALHALPVVTENKRTLLGMQSTFRCRQVRHEGGHLVLLYVSARACSAGGVALPAGTVTLASYWTDRPYNVYHFLSPNGETLAYYFNVCDGTRVDAGREGVELSWRDLLVDVLLEPGRPARVLDRHELPDDLPLELRARIEQTLGALLEEAPALAAALEPRDATLLAALRGAGALDGEPRGAAPGASP